MASDPYNTDGSFFALFYQNEGVQTTIAAL
jgi:hypothetical protein